MRASSVAANSEVRMVPLARRVPGVSASRSVTPAKPVGVRSITKRLKPPSPSGIQRALSFLSWFSCVASAVTVRPARENSALRASALPRTKAVAAGSEMPRRFSRASAVSLERVTSVRNSVKLKFSSDAPLVGERHGRRGFENLLDREVGRVRTERCHREGAGAQQGGRDERGDLLGVGPECIGHARSKELLGGKNAVDQTLNSSSGSANPCCKAQYVQGGSRRCGRSAA
jgi:hypothetical protein